MGEWATFVKGSGPPAVHDFLDLGGSPGSAFGDQDRLGTVLPANVAGCIILWDRPGIFLRHESSPTGRCEFNHRAP